VTEIALAYGPAETASQLEALFHFGTLDPDELSPSAQEALFAGNILESTDGTPFRVLEMKFEPTRKSEKSLVPPPKSPIIISSS